jgi:hypothetical protein
MWMVFFYVLNGDSEAIAFGVDVEDHADGLKVAYARMASLGAQWAEIEFVEGY